MVGSAPSVPRPGATWLFEVVDCLIYLLSIAGMVGIEDIEQYVVEKRAHQYPAV